MIYTERATGEPVNLFRQVAYWDVMVLRFRYLRTGVVDTMTREVFLREFKHTPRVDR